MKLFAHQERAVAWLKSRPKALLALDAGLGKTCIASLDLTAPALVVCPASLKLNWQNELNMWRPELSVQVVRTPKDLLNGSDVTIVNYDILAKIDLPQYNTLIIDESHSIKNYKAQRTKAVCKLIKSTPKVRLLSGTPVINRPIELWTGVYSIGATKLGYMEFARRYCAAWQTPWGSFDVSGASNQKELVKVLEPFMLRQTKDTCLDLPEKTYRIIELDLPVDKRESQFTLDQIEKPDSIPFEAISDVRRMNAERKLDQCLAYIKDLLESVPKVVVFAHHAHIIEAIEDDLKSFKPVVVMGSTKNDDRQKAVDTFQTDPKCRVFIGNIAAAGVGITLTASSYVVMCECPWSPALLHQAADRTYRIGQRNAVTVDLLTIKGSIDSIILHKILTKEQVIDQIITESKSRTVSTILHELADIIERNP